MRKRTKHRIEAAALWVLLAFFKALPLDIASWIGGALARGIGPFLGAHRVAERNLGMIYPQMSATERRRLLSRMWDNLGRTAAELPHLSGDKLLSRVRMDGIENLPSPARPIILFGGHLGNWELAYALAHRRGIQTLLIYRKANNPIVEAMIGRIRAAQSAAMIAKGPHSAIKIVRAIKNGLSPTMLIDQKMNDGIAVPFFGRPAMTAPAIAEFSLRFDLPLIPARVVRTRGCHFEATIYPPLAYGSTGDEKQDVRMIMETINAMLEGWIREHPGQWFWVHKRWPNA